MDWLARRRVVLLREAAPGTADSADRRRTLFKLTKRGRQVSAGAHGTVEAAVAAALAHSPAAHRVATRRFLERLAEALDGRLQQATPSTR